MTAIRKPASGEAGLWLRWVLANAIGETIGLGCAVLLGAAGARYVGEGTGFLAVVGLSALAVLAGTLIEGTVVGTAQWLVLRGPLPLMRWRTWVLATGAGAFLAWTLGMVPSTLLSLDSGGGAPPAEPGEETILGLAFLMGLVLGPVLGLAQWLSLRRFVKRAALWMPANALAWAFGMVVVFAGMDLAFGDGFGPGTVPILVLTLLWCGATVGAIHGLALMWLLRSARRLDSAECR
jgi:hypothetical protein